MNTLNDADLVKLCKENDPKALEVLYLRYLPFINKKFSKFKKTFTSTLIEREDFQSDCYIALCKAVKYVNFDKIPRPDTWKFLGAFMYYIDGYVWETVRQFNRKEVLDTALFVSNGEGDEIALTDLNPDLATEGASFDSLYEKETLTNFYMSLSPFEMEVLKQRTQIREKGKPKQLTEIAREMGTNFNKIQDTCKTLEVKFKRSLVY